MFRKIKKQLKADFEDALKATIGAKGSKSTKENFEKQKQF